MSAPTTGFLAAVVKVRKVQRDMRDLEAALGCEHYTPDQACGLILTLEWIENASALLRARLNSVPIDVAVGEFLDGGE